MLESVTFSDTDVQHNATLLGNNLICLMPVECKQGYAVP
jgi:hypothetical protein